MGTSYIVATAHVCENFSKGVDHSGPWIRVTYFIQSYEDCDRFINALVGAGTLTGPISGGKVTRNTPHFHPQAPNLACVSASLITGLGNPSINVSGLPDYDGGALIAAEYRALSWDAITPDTNNSIDPATSILYATQSLNMSSEIFTVGESKFKYVGGGETDVPLKFSIPITELTLTFHRYPYLPMTAVRNLGGKVNSTTFLGAQAGCVLFKHCNTEREFNSDGSVCQKVIMVFVERRSTAKWNWLPSRTSTTFQLVTSDGTSGGGKMYEEGDLNALLNP